MIELNKENFDQEVISSENPVLVDFWGPRCGPCKELMPHIDKMKEEYGDKIKFTSVDTSKSRRLAIGQKVKSLPSIVIYKGGEEVDRLVGEGAGPGAVEEMLKKYI